MSVYKLSKTNWYLERVIFLMAGVFVLGSVVLSVVVDGAFMFFAGFVGLLLVIFALTGYCPMAIMLNKLGIKGRLNKVEKVDSKN